MTERPDVYEIGDPKLRALTERALERLAERMVDYPDMMGALLKQFAQSEGLFTDERLAERLGIDTDGLRHLRLCARPNGASPLFGEQVQQIAAHVGMDPVLLANVVRQVEALAAMHESGATVKAVLRESRPMAAKTFALSAARDRLPEEEAQHLRESRLAYGDMAMPASSPSAAPMPDDEPPAEPAAAPPGASDEPEQDRPDD